MKTGYVPPKSQWKKVKIKGIDKPMIAPWGFEQGPHTINLVQQ